jgi:hypothetical protein
MLAKTPNAENELVSLAERLHQLFAGNEHTHGTYSTLSLDQSKGKQKMHRPDKLDGGASLDMWRQHIAGERALGIVPIRADETCAWGAIDVDQYDLNHAELAARIKREGLPLLPCRSKSGGCHIFVFFREPEPAGVVQEALKRVALHLGFPPSTEVFAKQTSYSRGDKPDWLNMPYFGGDASARFGVKITGSAMTLQEFVQEAEGERTTTAELLSKLKTTKHPERADSSGPDWTDGPPCIERMIGDGPFEADGKKRLSYNLAVYLKKKYPADWEDRLRRANDELISPPVADNDLGSTIRSGRRKEYQYKEEPLCLHCDRDLCRTRPFGIGGATERASPPKPALQDLLKNARELQTKVFDPLRWIVPDYLPEGLTVLAGKPKVGKSWLALDIGSAVAAGGICLGKECEQGDVLALFLEDNDRRLQRRLTMLLGAQREEWPSRLTYATAWPCISDGGLELMREWIAAAKKPRLIVVDILERVRSRTSKKDQQKNAYADDYDALAALQKLAIQEQLSILVLHHQRKMGAEDLVDTISGTLGLGGAADSILVLGTEKRPRGEEDGEDDRKFLYGRGRDLEEFKVSVDQDERCRWQVGGEWVEAQVSPEREQLLALLRNAGQPMHYNDVAEKLGKKPGTTRRLLAALEQAGEIVRVGRGTYRTPDPQADLII